MKMSPFNYQIKVLGVVDTGYTDEYGIREVLSKSEGILAKQEAVKEKILIDRFHQGGRERRPGHLRREAGEGRDNLAAGREGPAFRRAHLRQRPLQMPLMRGGEPASPSGTRPTIPSSARNAAGRPIPEQGAAAGRTDGPGHGRARSKSRSCPRRPWKATSS